MYSVVLMAALATGAGSQECHFHGGGYGCYGGCYSSYCSGCYGGCYGCYGGYSYGCCGCWGGCYGGGYGVWGSYYGCHGGWGGYSYGCWGGCWGGCYGGYAVVNPVIVPEVPVGPGPGNPGPGPSPDKGKGKGGDQVRATLTVELPADAQLYVDNVLMKTTSSKRSFVTPPLQTGKTYFYNLKAQMVRNGETVTVTGQVVVQPGQSLQAVLTEPSNKGTFVVRTGNPQ